jgi:hypothetical protein
MATGDGMTHLVHPCIEPGCTEEGSFGEGVSLRKDILGTWRCLQHWRRHLEEQARRAQSESNPPSSQDLFT